MKLLLVLGVVVAAVRSASVALPHLEPEDVTILASVFERAVKEAKVSSNRSPFLLDIAILSIFSMATHDPDLLFWGSS